MALTVPIDQHLLILNKMMRTILLLYQNAQCSGDLRCSDLFSLFLITGVGKLDKFCDLLSLMQLRLYFNI